MALAVPALSGRQPVDQRPPAIGGDRQLRQRSRSVRLGRHSLALVQIWIEPHQSCAVPVLIGTVSVVPDLGYAGPPGQWRLAIELQTDSGSMLSAPLEITTTP